MSWRPLHEQMSTWSAARRCSDARYMDGGRHHLLLHATSWSALHGRRLTPTAATRDILTSATWIEDDINCCNTRHPDVRYMDGGWHQLLQHATSWHTLHGQRLTSTAATRDSLTSATWTEVDINYCNTRRVVGFWDGLRLPLRLTSRWSEHELVSVWTFFLRSASNETESTHQPSKT